MDHIDPISIAALLIAVGAALRAQFHSNARKTEAKTQALDLLGRKYASLGWAYSKQQADYADPAKARKHAVEGFVIADTSADGKRDFTDKQAGVYVDGCKQ